MVNKQGKKSLSEKNLQFLSYLNSLSKQRKIKCIKFTCNQNEINTLLEIIINFLNKNINVKNSL